MINPFFDVHAAFGWLFLSSEWIASYAMVFMAMFKLIQSHKREQSPVRVPVYNYR
jgi:hypothetical protein